VTLRNLELAAKERRRDCTRGGRIVKVKQVMPTTWLLLAIVVAIALHFLFPVVRIVPVPWNLLGILLLAAGVAINLVADGAFRKANTTVKPFQESSSLIVDGAFRTSRNPMYLGFVLILIGVAVLLGSLAPYAVVLAFAILMDRAYVRVEERMLAAKFGGEWEAYRQTTRRWL
jgi:protein-S-isoprenylcysteine O-methyltransferase Ste14